IFTQNPAEMQGGRRAHSPALENKFRKIYLRDDFTPEELTRIVAETMPRLAPIASDLVEVHAEALKILANDNETLTLRDLQRWGLIATSLIETKTLSPEDAIFLGAELVYPGRTLNLEVRDELERVLDKFYQGIHQNDLSFLNESHPELRQTIRRALAKENVTHLYDIIAESEGMGLNVWLARKFKDASTAELRELFQELGWDPILQALWIGEFKIQSGLAILPEIMSDPIESARNHAVQALEKLGNPAARPILEKALNDARFNPAVVASALGALGDPNAGPALEKVLNNSDPELVLNAATSLLRLGNDKGAQALMMKCLTHTDANIRARAARVLGEQGCKTARVHLEKLLTDDPYETVQEAAALALADLGLAESKAVLQKCLKTGPIEVALALEKLGDPTGRHILLEGLKSVDGVRRESCALALAQLKDPAAYPALEQLLNQNLGYRTAEVVRAIAELGGLNARPILERALTKPNRLVAIAAADALGELNDTQSRPALEKALKSADQAVQNHAAGALDKISPGWDGEGSYIAEVRQVIGEELNRGIASVETEKAETLQRLLKHLPN
ncbi:MAG TPA: HEAT repeat domain-containing protein, partial [bacterium]|nr:HEAT repeat domain-containing protein [bacterium]